MYLGQNAIAITCFTTFVLGVVGMFLTGRKKQNCNPKFRSPGRAVAHRWPASRPSDSHPRWNTCRVQAFEQARFRQPARLPAARRFARLVTGMRCMQRRDDMWSGMSYAPLNGCMDSSRIGSSPRVYIPRVIRCVGAATRHHRCDVASVADSGRLAYAYHLRAVFAHHRPGVRRQQTAACIAWKAAKVESIVACEWASNSG
jgi:hypothetical protein